jgi:integrase
MSRLEYLNQFESKSTVHAYRAALKRFFQTIYNVQEPSLEKLAEQYFNEQRSFEADVQAFAVALKGAPPKTRRLYLTAVKIFLLENGVELPQLFWRRLRARIKGSEAISEEEVPSKQTLRSVMVHLPIAGKALFSVLVSSGMRIGEALKLQLGDLELEKSPPLIRIRAEYTKTGHKRITFITPEAAGFVREWLKVRENWLKAAAEKSHLYSKSLDDQRLFPFTSANARAMWRNALRKTGNGKVDPRTRRLLMRPHVLRKYFRSMVGSVAGMDVAEALMGHASYLSEVYRKYPDPEKTLAEAYRKAVPELQIFTEEHPDEARIKTVEERSRLLENMNVQLQTRLMALENENTELKQRLQKLEQKLSEIEKALAELAG